MRTSTKHTHRARALAVLLAVLMVFTVLAPVGALAADPPWGEITSILRDIMEGDSICWDVDQQPLACQSDKNGDGVWELLLVYPCKDKDGRVYVSEAVWLIDGDQSKKVNSGVLFNEVGGNDGTLSLAEKNGTLYVLIESHQPDGSDFYDLIDIFSLKEGEAALGDDYFMMSRTGTYGAEDEAEYIIDEAVADQDEYEDTLDSFDVYYTIDIMNDPDGDGDVVPFNVLLM